MSLWFQRQWRHDDDDHEPLLSSETPQTRHLEGIQSLPGAPNDQRWYHGRITDDEADRRLRCVSCKGRNGEYLVYDNPWPSREGEYALLVYKDGELHKWRITRRADDKYVLGEDKPGARAHISVKKLIEYHRGLTGKAIPLEQGGQVTLSGYAYVKYEDRECTLTEL